MSKMFSVIALGGDKVAASQAARDEVFSSTVLAVKDGNTRNLSDTIGAIRADGGITKSGEYAKSKKGGILAALVEAFNAATSSRQAYLVTFAGHTGKASPAMLERAQAMACAIADAFEHAAIAACAPKVKTKTKTTEAATAKAEDEATATATAKAEDEATATATEAATDMEAAFAAFMAEAVRQLGRTAIHSILTNAMVEKAKADKEEEEALVKLAKAKAGLAKAAPTEAAPIEAKPIKVRKPRTKKAA